MQHGRKCEHKKLKTVSEWPHKDDAAIELAAVRSDLLFSLSLQDVTRESSNTFCRPTAAVTAGSCQELEAAGDGVDEVGVCRAQHKDAACVWVGIGPARVQHYMRLKTCSMLARPFSKPEILVPGTLALGLSSS